MLDIISALVLAAGAAASGAGGAAGAAGAARAARAAGGVADDVVVCAHQPAAVTHAAGFAQKQSPYAASRSYLAAVSQPGATQPASVRIAAPPGPYYAYLAWVRHPRGARDVRVRVAGREVRLDQSRLANGASPDALARDDMPEFDGACTSGLFRLTDAPATFRPGDVLEVFRSDAAPDTWTTLDYVVFSPRLYLDDLGNDASCSGRPMVNLKNYGPQFSGPVGMGIAFLSPTPPGAIQWKLPAAGVFWVEIDANRGPNRAKTASLELVRAGGRRHAQPFDARSEGFGRGGWQSLGAIRAQRGDVLTVRAGGDGVVAPDLVRLTPAAASELAPPDSNRGQSFLVQWEGATPTKPWLRQVRVVSASDGVSIDASGPVAAGMVRSARVTVRDRWLRLWGEQAGLGVFRPGDGACRVELADDYGVTLSAGLLRREKFVWLPSLGVFACAEGDFASHAAARQALAEQAARAGAEPFRSTSERYLAWTGYDEWRPGQDDRAFEFAYRLPRPPAARVGASIAAMPEVNYQYFCDRFADLKYRRMFLGWANVAQEFCVLSNGALSAASGSNIATGHPPADDFRVAFGVGSRPRFRDHGDTTVTQSIDQDWLPIVSTTWREDGDEVVAATAVYPMAGEEVRTGNEPLAAHVRLLRRSGDSPLWLRVTAEHYGEGKPKPLAGLNEAKVDGGRVVARSRTILAVDHAEVAIASATSQELVLRVTPKDGRADLVVPYRAVDPSLVDAARRLGFDAARAAVARYWTARESRGTRIDLPDAAVVHSHKAIYPRTLVVADLDARGDYALKTSSHIYEYVWLHCTSYGIEGLARRGHFDEARQYLEAGFRWQGSQASDASKDYTDWKGFFTAPPHYTALLWLNYHGWFQWAAARYYLFSDDRPWLEAKLPALITSLEWTARQRRLSMKPSVDGSRPIQYGWLPPGRVTDGSSGTSTFTDCINWMGFAEVVRALERIGHPRAAEFRAEADDYRRCILRGLRRAAALREPVRLADGTFVPYVPGYLESQGHEESMWYAAVVDGALEGILDSGVVPPGDPLEDWVLGNLEDNLFVMAPNLADEGHFLGHACGYLRRNEPSQAIYTFYSALATQCARQTRTTFEHRSWGANRIYDLAPWPMGYLTRVLSGMLCHDEGDELVYCRATPRAWLAPGKAIRVERLQTRFGPTSFTLSSQDNGLRGAIELPTRYAPKSTRLRLSTPKPIARVTVDGVPAVFDSKTQSIAIPPGKRRVEVSAQYAP